MGCHTWFYRKEERTLEQARKKFIDHTRYLIDWVTEVASEEEYLQAQHFKEVSLRKIRMVQAGLCNVAVFNHQPETTSRYIPGKGFYVSSDEMPHDLFRVGNYPNNLLFSLEETIHFINTHTVHSICWNELKQFWEKYPDGMIKFG